MTEASTNRDGEDPFEDAVKRFIDNASVQTYATLREVVMRAENYDPMADLSASLSSIAGGDHFATVNAVGELMPGFFLNPTAHAVMGNSLESLGQSQSARLERYLADVLLQMLLSAGDGSYDRPFVVTSIADEYDVLAAVELQPESQQLVKHDLKYFDVVSGGKRECWFQLLWM